MERWMIGLSAACRWISVSMMSGSSAVKKPAPCTGGSWNGSPSTSTLTPKLSRSLPSCSSTMDTSSMTMRSASAAGLSSSSTKRGSPSFSLTRV
ncbi:hypothetical protein D3C72_2186130 [compost metagenome]